VRAGNTLRAVAETHLRFEETKPADKRLRTIDQRRRVFERLIFPVLGGRPIAEIRRSEIVKLLDNVATTRGGRMADETLSVLSILFTWHAKRSDDFHSPIVRGMGITKPKDRGRSRILCDDELARVWRAADDMGAPFGRFVQFLLLTATRRNESARMVWSEVNGDDWTIPARRYKTGLDHVVPLSAKARALLDQMPRFAGSDFVFTVDGRFPISEFSRGKRKLDKLSDVIAWRLHDLRRQARTMLGRAGVNGEIGERCLGHVPGGIRAVYDQFEYRDQKAHAFEQLAMLVSRIVNSPPEGDNVVQLRA
jgi:integrase